MLPNELLTNIQYIRKLYESCLSSAQQANHLTRFEVAVISVLHTNPELDTANHIVEYLSLPKANVSKAVDSLLKKGMLQTRRDCCDRRKIHLTLTESAAAAAADIASAQDLFSARLFSGISPEDMSAFLRFLRMASGNAKAALEDV